MKRELPEIRPEERTPLVEALLGMVRQLLDRVGELEQTNQQLGDEMARLKGQNPQPEIKPSTLEGKDTRGQGKGNGQRAGSAKRPKNAELTIHHEVPLHPTDLAAGATFKSFEPYVVQELNIQNVNTRYQRARYELPGGGSVIDISSGQLQRILTEHKDHFHQEKSALLAAGLAESSYVGTDDTGARHQGQNGFCTALGNDLFAYFESSASKSRLNFSQVRATTSAENPSRARLR